MDIGHVIVGVLTMAAASWLIWVEMRSRRVEARQDPTEEQKLRLIKSRSETQWQPIGKE